MNPNFSLDMSAELRSQFAALHWQCKRLYVIEKFSKWTNNLIQTNKQTLIRKRGGGAEVKSVRLTSGRFLTQMHDRLYAIKYPWTLINTLGHFP